MTLSPALAQPPKPPQPDDTSKVAAQTDAEQHLTIQVLVNGKGPFRFVVDTGADRSVVADTLVAALGMLPGQEVMVAGVVRTLQAQTVKLANISFGDVSRNNLVVPILPRALLAADGYLGLDVIDGHRVTLDFKNRALLITEPHYVHMLGILPPYEARVSLFGQQGHLRAVNCSVDGVRAATFIDTGAEVSVGNNSLYDALVNRDPSYIKLQTVPITGVTGGVIDGRVTSVRRVKLNGVTFEDCNIAIADMQIFKLWGLADTPAMLIGMNFLRQFAQVSIDYGSKEIRFDLARLILAERT
ncbi:MAG: aspartyl protease family protein [Alphaproteobacteria bacterium]|nr:aspartyl protease family protein [Alphaproteobacteria bacterium]MDE2493252.1 aspartyl protease family protein [Alphaproteobacteria bacterium]